MKADAQTKIQLQRELVASKESLVNATAVQEAAQADAVQIESKLAARESVHNQLLENLCRLKQLEADILAMLDKTASIPDPAAAEEVLHPQQADEPAAMNTDQG